MSFDELIGFSGGFALPQHLIDQIRRLERESLERSQVYTGSKGELDTSDDELTDEDIARYRRI